MDVAFNNYGLSGIIIGALFSLLYLLVNDHKNERIEWLNAFKELKSILEKIVNKL